MTHYLADWKARETGEKITVGRWNDMVDDFDVETLAEQLRSVGAGYYLVTIGQNSGFYLAPNKTYDRFVGVQPSRCSRRDLIADLYEPLHKRGIKLLVYLPSGAPAGDSSAKSQLNWQNGASRNLEFQKKWEEVIREWSVRWGKKVSGWWFDGCYWPNTMYRTTDTPNFTSFARAARQGNPESIVAFNPGVVPRIISVTPEEDYTAGEIDHPDRISIRRAEGGRIDGAQLHVLSYLGTRWGGGPPRFSADQAIRWSRMVAHEGGVITWDVPVLPGGTIPQRFVEQLKSIGTALSSPSSAVPETTKTVVSVKPRRRTSPGVPGAHLDYAPGKPPTSWSRATAETIMERYPDYRQAYWKDWTYVQGYMFQGFEMLYHATRDKKYLDYMKGYVDHFVDSEGNFTGDSLTNLDNLMTGTTIVALYEYTRDKRYRIAANQFRKVFDSYPRSDGQFWHGNKSPNMWVDGIFMGQMFLLRYGKSIGDAEYSYDEAARQISVFAKHCRKGSTGLYYHAWTEAPEKTTWADPTNGLSPEVWSEGLGWFALVIVEALAQIPQGHPQRSAVEDIYRGLTAGLAGTQDPISGGWFMIVDRGDRPGNWIDPSGTAMFVYSIQRGIELGLLDPTVFGPVVERAYRSLVESARINDQGLVDIHGAGDGITIKKDYETYINVPRIVNAKEAVAGFLWATAIMEKSGLSRLKGK
jgi:unsaturated rhamnogalacturonyl hydrolase